MQFRNCLNADVKSRHTRGDWSQGLVAGTSSLKNSHDGTMLQGQVPFSVYTLGPTSGTNLFKIFTQYKYAKFEALIRRFSET